MKVLHLTTHLQVGGIGIDILRMAKEVYAVYQEVSETEF